MRLNFSNDVNTTEWPSESLAESILERLSGFARYPQTPKGREIFIEALMGCESEQHARAAIQDFDERFPTLRELRDAVLKTKPKTQEPTPADLIEKWKSEGATFDPDWWPRTLREALAAKELKDAEDREQLRKLGQEIDALRPSEPQG